MKLKFSKSVFEFENLKGNESYSAHWYPNKTAPDLARKYEVAIFRGGGYYVSYYTDQRISQKNSLEFIQKHLGLRPVFPYDNERKFTPK